jgi:hypothetical protein
MKKRVIRLLLLALVLGITAAAGSPSQADPLCPTDSCWTITGQCIAEGGNHDYFPYTTTVGTCTDGVDTWSLRYVQCCRLPGCTQQIWVKYCYQ